MKFIMQRAYGRTPLSTISWINQELAKLLKEYVGRPSLLYYAKNDKDLGELKSI